MKGKDGISALKGVTTRRAELDWQRVQSVEDLELGRKYLFRPEFIPLLYSYLGIRCGVIVADVGCGTGSFSRLIARGLEGKGKIVGIDLDRNLLKIAGKMAEAEGLSDIIEFMCGDAYSLPLKDEAFDITTSHTLLDVLKNPMKCILEKKRVTKQGGIVSAVDTIGGIGATSYRGDYKDFSGIERLKELEDKNAKVWRERIFPKLAEWWWSNIQPSQFPKLFRDAGLKDIKVNGYLSLFSISDSRYSLQEMKEYLRRDYEDRVRKIRRSFIENRKEYEEGGVADSDIEELIALWKQKYEYLVREPKRIREVWEMEARPRIIITGINRTHTKT